MPATTPARRAAAAAKTPAAKARPAAPAKPARARGAAKRAAAKPDAGKKSAAKPAAPEAPRPNGAAGAPAAEAKKPPKPALVRDGFTMPEGEYAVIAQVKQRAVAAGRPVKKSEVLRAGLMLLAALDDTRLQAALAAVPALKTGRPKGEAGVAAADMPKAGKAKRKKS